MRATAAEDTVEVVVGGGGGGAVGGAVGVVEIGVADGALAGAAA